MITYDKLFIGGTWTEPSNPQLLDILSPHDESVVGRAAQAQPADVDRAVAIARAAFDEGTWPNTPPAERIAVLRLAQLPARGPGRGDSGRDHRGERFRRLVHPRRTAGPVPSGRRLPEGG
ncbi:hypothetical protein GCM10020000_03340 [Streptomyces olivoverticillatus]